VFASAKLSKLPLIILRYKEEKVLGIQTLKLNSKHLIIFIAYK